LKAGASAAAKRATADPKQNGELASGKRKEAQMDKQIEQPTPDVEARAVEQPVERFASQCEPTPCVEHVGATAPELQCGTPTWREVAWKQRKSTRRRTTEEKAREVAQRTPRRQASLENAERQAREFMRVRRLELRAQDGISCAVTRSTTPSPHPRERRDGSRRHSTRGGTDDDSGGSESEPEPLDERLCAGCKRPIGHRRRDAQTCGPVCRKRTSRARLTGPGDPQFAPARRAGLTRPNGRRCESCGAFLSRYHAGVLCSPCEYSKTADPQDPDLDEILCGLIRTDGDGRRRYVDVTLAGVLIGCGGWPRSSKRAESRVIAVAAGLNVTLSDTQAGRLIERFGSGEAAGDALAAMARAERYRRRQADELPEPYSLEQHRARHARLSPSDQLDEFIRLPGWQRAEAWATLRARSDRLHDAAPPAVVA
jgi:hypothetical protein